MAHNSALVIECRVLKYGPKLSFAKNFYESMTIEVIHVIKGKYSDKTLKILGDPGHLCRPYVTSEGFPIGEHFLFALPASEKNPQALSVCGEYYIHKKGNTLSLSLEDFKKRCEQTQGIFMDCAAAFAEGCARAEQIEGKNVIELFFEIGGNGEFCLHFSK